MRYNLLAVLSCVLLACPLTLAHPTGAPESVCDSMIPGHGFEPQQSPAPYSVVVTPWQQDEMVEMNVTLSGTDGAIFKGFMLQARAVSGGGAIGTFVHFDPTSYTRNCNNGENNSLTHISKEAKSQVQVTWRAPHGWTADIQFVTSFVESYSKYWVGVRSQVVHFN